MSAHNLKIVTKWTDDTGWLVKVFLRAEGAVENIQKTKARTEMYKRTNIFNNIKGGAGAWCNSNPDPEIKPAEDK